MVSAAAVIIGNEILSGKFTDENSPWLARRLRSIGVDLARIHVIPDDVDVIADTVRTMAGRFTHVFTSGGVGPTHDDVTFEGVARAFDVPIERNVEIEAALKKHMGANCTPAALRMADIPQGTCLVGEGFPVLVCRNVVILPGVPIYFRRKFDLFAQTLDGAPMESDRLTTTMRESTIAAILSEAAKRWPAVDIGSYPRVETNPPSVIVTLDSRDAHQLSQAREWLSPRLVPSS